MLDKWSEMSERFLTLTLRERAIALAVCIALCLFLWLQFAFSPFEDGQKNKRLSLMQNYDEITVLTEKLATFQQKIKADPNAPLREQELALNHQLKELGVEIEQHLSNLLAPQKMAQVLKTVLSDYQGLKLLKARNLPVQALTVPSAEETESSDGDEAEPDRAAIFSHGFEMQFEGEYFQTLQFLQRLETMEGFYWQLFDYQVDGYPRAIITIQLNTLSLEEGWIGV
jgi:MSHA biogenesis protein MshJ